MGTGLYSVTAAVSKCKPHSYRAATLGQYRLLFIGVLKSEIIVKTSALKREEQRFMSGTRLEKIAQLLWSTRHIQLLMPPKWLFMICCCLGQWHPRINAGVNPHLSARLVR